MYLGFSDLPSGKRWPSPLALRGVIGQSTSSLDREAGIGIGADGVIDGGLGFVLRGDFLAREARSR